MQELIIKKIAEQTGLKKHYINQVVKLLDEGATIPFISRYRKEMTGEMDEVQVGKVQDVYKQTESLLKRKTFILGSIEEQGKMTDVLRRSIEDCWDSNELEDIYLPFKPRRKTRADKAREQGLEPLAKILMAQRENDPERRAESFLNEDIRTVEDALQGARDIIAEWINENTFSRKRIRDLFQWKAILSSKVVKTKIEEAAKYLDYFDYKEKLTQCPSYRLLAVFRAEKEGLLRVKCGPDEEEALKILERIFIKDTNESSDQVQQALKDSYTRLIFPSLENETKATAKMKADESAIEVFAGNLRQLLLEAPFGQKRILAIDPGFRSGCKLVCLDDQGNLIHNQNIYPFGQEGDKIKASKQIKTMVSQFKIDAIAIGNGTASRESEALVRNIRFDRDVKAFVVSEDGASVYSASEIAREEFAKYDVTVRGAVSIGRRLMDPLSELVKIDPKSLGIGQYQHEVDQAKLKNALDRVTESCVNQVGVNVNTASKYILKYISGIGDKLATNLVEFRSEKGAFTERKQLMKVALMGAKAYEQCAGFLRIKNGKQLLDNTGVHPESYGVVDKMAQSFGVDIEQLLGNKVKLQELKLENFVNEKTGLPTLRDIVKELSKPGIDPRGQAAIFSFDEKIKTMDDLYEGLVLPGIVNNITDFGAFVDIGIKENGLIHKSQMADKFVADPNEVVSLHQQLQVRIVSIDKERMRIGLSLKDI